MASDSEGGRASARLSPRTLLALFLAFAALLVFFLRDALDREFFLLTSHGLVLGAGLLIGLKRVRARRTVSVEGALALMLWLFVLGFTLLNAAQAEGLEGSFAAPIIAFDVLVLFFVFHRCAGVLPRLAVSLLIALFAGFLLFLFIAGPLAGKDETPGALGGDAFARAALRAPAVRALQRNWLFGLGAGGLAGPAAAMRISEARELRPEHIPYAPARFQEALRQSMSPATAPTPPHTARPAMVFAWSAHVSDAPGLLLLLAEIGLVGMGIVSALVLFLALGIGARLATEGGGRSGGMILVLFVCLLASLFLAAVNTALHHPFTLALVSALAGAALGFPRKKPTSEKVDEGRAPSRLQLIGIALAAVVLLIPVLSLFAGARLAEMARSDRGDATVALLRKAAVLHPFSAEIRLNLAEALVRLSPREHAPEIEAALRAATRLAPWRARAYAAQAGFNLSIQQYADAEFALEEGRGRAPFSPLNALWEVELAQALRDERSLRRGLLRAIQLMPTEQTVLRLELTRELAALLEKQGDYSGALDTWSRIFQETPDDEQSRRAIERLSARVYSE